MCGNTGPLYATSNQLCAPLQPGATTEGLCALHGSPESPATRVVDEHMLVEKFCDEEGLDDDQTEDHQELEWVDAAVTFDTFVIDFNHVTKHFDPMDADTDILHLRQQGRPLRRRRPDPRFRQRLRPRHGRPLRRRRPEPRLRQRLQPRHA
jgi:hypothetical protein